MAKINYSFGEYNEAGEWEVFEWELVELHTGSGRISSTIGYFRSQEDAEEYVDDNRMYSPFRGGHYDILTTDEVEERIERELEWLNS